MKLKLSLILMSLLILQLEFDPGDGCKPADDGGPPSCNPWCTSASVAATALKDMIPERKGKGEDAAKATINWTKKLLKGLPKILSAAGFVFAFAGFVSAFLPDPDHQEIMNQFKQVHDEIHDVKNILDEMKDLIVDEHAKTRIHPFIKDLEEAKITFGYYIQDPKTWRGNMARYIDNNKIYEGLMGIYNTIFDSDSIISTLYKKSNGDWMRMDRQRRYVTALLAQGQLAYTTSCILHMQDYEGKTPKEATRKCMKESASIEDLFSDFNEKFEKHLDQCKENYLENADKDIVSIMSNHRDESNGEVWNKIKDKISIKYFWLDYIIIVYDDIRGYDKHKLIAGIIHLHENNKNVAVMLNEKPGYRNPFVRSTNYAPLYDFSKQQIADNIQANIYPIHHSDDAQTYYDRIWNTQSGLFKINGMFVSKSTSLVDNTMGLVQGSNSGQYYPLDMGWKDAGWHVKVIIFFDHSEVSWFTQCPKNYPYAFNEGIDCRDRLVPGNESWFDNMQYNYQYCPSSNPCRNNRSVRMAKRRLGAQKMKIWKIFNIQNSVCLLLAVTILLLVLLIMVRRWTVHGNKESIINT